MNPTDKIVAELLKKVEEKEKAIPDMEKGSWKTKCSYAIGEGRVNIQTCNDIRRLVELHATVSALGESIGISMEVLGVSDIMEVLVQGYSPEKWHSDIARRVNNLSIDMRVKELATLKKQIDNLKSDELKTSMQLEELSKKLGL